MNIQFFPQRRDDTLTVSKAGDVLTVNGVALDFSTLADGSSLPYGTVPSEFIMGPVERVAGDLKVRLILPLGPNPSAAQTFPTAIDVTTDGPITLPA